MKKIIFSLAFLLIVHFTFIIDNCVCQWIYQALPSYYEVRDVKFFDANTGIITIDVPGRGMLRTTNGGNNWTVIDTNVLFFEIQKIDSVTLYGIGRNRSAIDRIQRTTNKGLTWDSTNFPLSYGFISLSFVNKDTGWISGFNNGYLVWRTTNGGITLQQQGNIVGDGEIFFLRQKVNGEYYGWQNNDVQLWRTTNSGVNWFQVSAPSAPYLFHIQFINENTGWFSAGYDGIYKTINGGMNWVNQPLAPGIAQIIRGMTDFICITNDTIYGVSSYKNLLSGRTVGIIWKTTNSGMNWGYQQPDTNYHNGAYHSIDFVDNFTGWAYQGNGVHTTNGGGIIIFPTYINNNSTEIINYELKQNYPNPFNSSTTIEFTLPKDSYVKLIIYDITGKIIMNVINGFSLSEGTHRFRIDGFDKQNISSGTYFYRLEIFDNKNNMQFIKTNRMIYLK